MKKFFFAVISVTIALFLLFNVFVTSPGIISYGDNAFLFNKSYLSSWSPYFSNGIPRDSVVWQYGFMTVFTNIFLSVGLNYSVVSKIIFFTPIIISAVLFLMLIYMFTKSKFLSFLGMSFFLLSGITIEYLLYYPVPYFWSVVSITLLLFFLFNIYERLELKWLDICIIGIISIFNFHPFFQFVYLLVLMCFCILFLLSRFSLNNVVKIITMFLLTAIVNLYWILPLVAGIFSGNSSPEVVYGSGNLEAVSSAYLSTSSIRNIIMGITYPISYSIKILKNPFIALFSFGFYLIFLVALVSHHKEEKVSKLIIAVFLLFLGLSFWPTNILLKDVFDILWGEVSVFRFFRSFNRFSIVLFPLMILSVAFFYNKIKNKTIVNIILLVIALLLLIGRSNVITGDLGGYVSVYEMPEYYIELNRYLEQAGGKDLRIITCPKVDYEAYTWNKNNSYKEFPQIYYLAELYLNGTVLQSKAATHLFRSNNFYKKIFNPEYCTNAEELIHDLEKIDIDYVLLNKDLIDLDGDIVSFEKYKRCLENVNFELVMSNEYFEFYKVIYDKKHESNYLIKEVYPFCYEVNFDFNGEEQSELIFPQNYNSGWKIYLDNNEGWEYLKYNAVPFYEEEAYAEHIDNEPGNKWVLRRSDFNEDKLNLYLYYYPQIYVVIGSAVSLVSVLILVFSIVVLLIKDTRKKEKITSVK